MRSVDRTSTQAPRGRRTNDPDGLRNRVLDAAARMFQRQGFHASAVHDLVAEAGVTSGALHHHFPSKKALGLAVLRERVGPLVLETWTEPLATAPSLAEGVAAVFRLVERELDGADQVRGCPLNNLALELSLADPEYRAEIDGIFAAWRAALAQALIADQAAGRHAGLDPEAFATLAVAAYSGGMAMSKAAQSTAPLKTCAAQILAMLGA
jgi:AcrR family transcriptional regulator